MLAHFKALGTPVSSTRNIKEVSAAERELL